MSTKQLPKPRNFPTKSYCVKKLSYEIKSIYEKIIWLDRPLVPTVLHTANEGQGKIQNKCLFWNLIHSQT